LHDGTNQIQFLEAEIKGEEYIRPSKASPLSVLSETLFKSDTNGRISIKETQIDGCHSDQIHLTLGDDTSSVIISFASNISSTASSIQFSMDEQALLSPSTATASKVEKYLAHSPY